jgi:hypothetical protein
MYWGASPTTCLPGCIGPLQEKIERLEKELAELKKNCVKPGQEEELER